MQNETEESVSKTDINVEPTENFPEKSEQPRRHVNPNKPKEVGELKCVGKELLFVPTSNQFAKCKDYRNTQSANPDELFMFIKCGANEYRIIGDSTKESISIKSILRKNKNGDYIDGNILRVEEEIRSVKKMLGLKDDVTEIKVDSIYNEPFGVKIPTTTAQQTVNNKEVTTESEKFYDAAEELDDDFHDAPEDFCNQPRSITGEPEAQIHYISNPSKVGNGYC